MRRLVDAESLPDCRQEGEPAPSKREAIRQLMTLGHTGAEAQHHYSAFLARHDDDERTWRNYVAFIRFIEAAPARNRKVRGRPMSLKPA